MYRAGTIWEISVPAFEFSCEPKTAPIKKKVLTCFQCLPNTIIYLIYELFMLGIVCCISYLCHLQVTTNLMA